ncbi:MAG: WecB/TagA/CpsF family glycosyltransferase [Cyanobacteria bacterium P01_G01_bin.67]
MSSTYDLLGIKVNLLSMRQLNSLIEEAVKLNSKRIIAHHNLNSLFIYHHTSIMRDFYRIVDYVHVDGMALIFMGKLLSLPFRREHRVTYADWVWSLMAEAAEKNWKILYVGSKPGIADRGASIIRNIYPNIHIDTLHGYFSLDLGGHENQAILEKINLLQPHVLMVGMGMPRQEKWILDNIEKIQANAILPCGACMDYVSGEIATPPRWMGRVGLEWLYRLLTEPKRLWRRYLVEPWFIVSIFLKAYLKHLKSKFFITLKRSIQYVKKSIQ